MNQCPKCGGEIWSNAHKNEQRANEGKRPLPLFACKDKDGCGWIKWPPKGQQSGGAGSRGHSASAGNAGAGPKHSRPLGPLYNECARIAAAVVKLHVPNATPTDVVAATATLFIAAANTGAPMIAPPKPKPAPPPEPEPEDDGGNMGNEEYNS